MAGSRSRQPNKASLIMRNELKARGIDLIEMQMKIYQKAIDAYDHERGCSEGGEGFGPADTGFRYLAVANQAVATLAKYSFPTMAAVKIENIDTQMTEKVIDAVEVRNTILNDPFATRIVRKIENSADLGLETLPIGVTEDESDNRD